MEQNNQDQSLGIQNQIKGGKNQVAKTIHNHNTYYLTPDSSAQELAKSIDKELQAEEKGNKDQQKKFKKNTEQINQKIAQAEKESWDKNRLNLKFRERIRKIDFDDPKKKFESIWNKCENQSGTILFLIEESHLKMGELYVEYMSDYLREKVTDFRYFPVGLSSDSRLDQIGLLNRLGTYFRVIDDDQQQLYEQQLIEKIIENIRQGLQLRSIRLFHFTDWHKLADPVNSLTWFLDSLTKNTACRSSHTSSSF
ncbi:MAG: hypothetical protein AB4062_18990 [Crocosphaera sp.]